MSDSNEFFDKAVAAALKVGIVLVKTNGQIHNGIVCRFKTTKGDEIKHHYSYFQIYDYLEGIDANPT